ncbi:MAG: hypothetical protein Q4C87_12910 [Actinomycetaceae bacterium]|nr:hypothetical protein [Actinomycetaceae bacterium]
MAENSSGQEYPSGRDPQIPAGFLRSLRWMRKGSTPVNKGIRRGAAGLRGQLSGGQKTGSAPGSRRLPQMGNPILVGIAGVAAIGVGAALSIFRHQEVTGRDERLTDLVRHSLGPGGDASVDLTLHEAFGKPAVVDFDIEVRGEVSGGIAAVSPQENLDRATQALWDNPEIAPIALRGRVIRRSAGNGNGGSLPIDEGEVLADMRTLGFDDDIARPADLYRKYGPPAADPGWRP